LKRGEGQSPLSKKKKKKKNSGPYGRKELCERLNWGNLSYTSFSLEEKRVVTWDFEEKKDTKEKKILGGKEERRDTRRNKDERTQRGSEGGSRRKELSGEKNRSLRRCLPEEKDWDMTSRWPRQAGDSWIIFRKRAGNLGKLWGKGEVGDSFGKVGQQFTRIKGYQVEKGKN